MKKILKAAVSFLAVGLALTGCGNQEAGSNSDSASGTENKAEENKSGEQTVYTAVLLPNDGGELGKENEAIIEEMNVALEPLNAKVDYQVADDYSVVSEAILSGTGQISIGSGATYVKARMENEKVIPILTYAPDGNLEKAGYTSYIGTNKSHAKDFEGLSDKEKLQKLKGQSFSFVSATSTSGRVVPTTTLWETFGPEGSGEVKEKAKIFEATDKDGGIFSQVQFAGSHPASVELIANDRVYAGAYCCDYAQKAGKENDIEIVYQQQVPGDPIWINSENMQQEHIDAIIKHFTELTPENAKSDVLFAPEGQKGGEGSGYYLNNNDRYIAVKADYYDILEKMFKDEM
ncbi:MAG: PhnD/SsuA/transferrin family substrate-binding protein [Finegoldia sp.]|nr:PhnD/SsuA/transferrin family substrate-binding protein [Finegoldia sp.]